jgi:hypothetical protein
MCNYIKFCADRLLIALGYQRHYKIGVGTLKDGYVRNVPLPRVPQRQSASHLVTEPVTMNPIHTGYSPVPSWIPTLPKLGSILGFSQRLL